MTIRETIVDLWELAGEPSDLDPWALTAVDYDPDTELDPNSRGVKHYLRQLTQAQISLANWRTSRGRPIRFKKFLTRKNVMVGLRNQDYTVVVLDDYTIRFTDLPAYIEPSMLESAKLIITYTDGTGATFEEEVQVVLADADGTNVDVQFRDPLTAPAFTPITTTASIYFDRFKIISEGSRPADGAYLSLPTSFRNIIKLIGMADGGELYRAESKEALDNPNLVFGLPATWHDIGETLYFDAYIEEPYWLTVEYQRLPSRLVDLDQSFDIPEEWHDILKLIVEWNTAKRLQENEKTQLLYSDITRWINTRRTDYEEEWLRTNTSGFQIRKEART